MITLPSPLTPGALSPGAGDAAVAIAGRSRPELAQSLVEIATSPARLPPLQLGETVTARLVPAATAAQPANTRQMTAIIKGESFVLALPADLPVDGKGLSLRVGTTAPLSFVLLDVLKVLPADAAATTAQSGRAANLRGDELARAVSAALEKETSTPLQTLAQPTRLPQLQRGEVVTGRLAERLPDGSAIVLVKNGAFTLKAPAETPLSKEAMLLRVARTEPSVQFNLLPAPLPADEKSSPVSFSSGGRYLTALLDAAVSRPSGGTAVTLLSNPAAPDAGEQLRQSVEKSGVFYESHQKAWVNGRLSLDELKQEPQARLHEARDEPVAAEGRTGRSFLAENSLFTRAVISQDSSQALLKPDSSAKASPQSELGHLVQKQLDLHEQKPFVFQGQAWPGQPVQWEIQREQVEERAARTPDELPVWQTRLNLSLPQLGGVGARLRMVGSQVQVMFDAEQADAAQLIDQHRSRLDAAMQAAGLSLASLQIRQEHADEA